MTGRVATAKALLTVALLTALTLFCVRDLVLAAVPQAAGSACATQLCDQQSDCGMPIAKAVSLPVAALTTEPPIAVPMSITPTPSAVAVPPFVGRQVIPLAPRSPPLA